MLCSINAVIFLRFLPIKFHCEILYGVTLRG